MADWQTVRFDPTYVEKLDPEIIPLCDALNAIGIVTTSSCVGHGHSWPHVWFLHSTDERIERLARFVKQTEAGDYRPHLSMWQKEILLPGSGVDTLLNNGTGYAWCVEIHAHRIFGDTPPDVRVKIEKEALACVTQAVLDFGLRELTI